MGAVSSCCAADQEGESQFDLQGDITPPTAEEKEEFMPRFLEGVEVHLVLQNKHKLVCKVRLDEQKEHLLLSCEEKLRSISLRDIKDILSSNEQLKRVEASAGITDPFLCAAIHLKSTGNCIPLFFSDAKDKALFVATVNDLRSLNP